MAVLVRVLVFPGATGDKTPPGLAPAPRALASGVIFYLETFVPFFSGPPKETVFGWAHDFAEAAIEIYKLPNFTDTERDAAVDRMRAEGTPTSLDELVALAASTVLRHELGWYRRNQFFGGLQGFTVLLGMPKGDAAYLVGLIRAQIRQESGR